MSTSRRDPARTASMRHDDRAVSEVIGQILSLGILSTLLIATLLGFGVAKDNATERSVSIRGDALLQRISSTAVQAALFAEGHPDADLVFNGSVDLPTDLEGHPYTVDLDPDKVTLWFPRFDGNVSAPLFQAGAGTDITICDQDPINGGPLRLIVQAEGNLDLSHACYGTSSTLVLYLETDS